MAEVGILEPRERVELLDGEIVTMFPIGHWHGCTVAWLMKHFVETSRDRWIVFPQSTFPIGPHDAPEPDLVIVRNRADFYRQKRHAAPDAFLVIEVADSSLKRDRDRKAPIYARAGVSEYWIVIASERVVEVYRAPVAGEYTVKFQVKPGEPLAPERFPEDLIDTATLLA